MELRLLKYMIAVSEELHFGKAAERLNISQPPLSQQIRKLEDDLGVLLFIRTKRSVKLTEAGKVLYEEALGILERIESAKQKTIAVHKGLAGTLTLGYVGPAMDGPLPEIIKNFKTDQNQVALSLQYMSTRAQLNAIRDGKVDLGAARIFDHDTRDLSIRPFHRESYVMAAPENHHLAGKSLIQIKELYGEPLIFFPESINPGLYRLWMECFRKEGFEPIIAIETATKQSAVSLVAAGVGLAVIPESTSLFKRKGVTYRPLSTGIPELILHMVWQGKRQHPARDRFLSYTSELI